MPGVVVLEDSDPASEPGEFDSAVVTVTSGQRRYPMNRPLAEVTGNRHVHVHEPVSGH